MQFILLHFREKLVSFSNSYNKRAVIKNVLVGSGDSDLNQNYALVYEGNDLSNKNQRTVG
jgi:hypothetical protein